MPITRATVVNQRGVHAVSLQTGEQTHALSIPPKAEGYGSSLTGGELLFLALATCYCNDIYREAAKRGLRVEQVEVDVEGEFEHEGAPASRVVYHARIKANASPQEIQELMRFTDTVAEVQNSLRAAVPVTLGSTEVIQTG